MGVYVNKDIIYMKKALVNARMAFELDEVPIGAVIVKDDKIIASAYNRKELDNVATYHAEIIAINEACKNLKTWHLDGCILYTTVEPCMMCAGAIKQARISRVVYGTDNPTFGYISKIDDKKIEIDKGLLSDECLELLSSFFKKKR